MPPIQIPDINRNAPQGEASVGRVDFKPIDTSAGENLQTKAALGLGESVAKYVQTEEKNAADTAGNAAAVKYHQDVEQRFEGDGGVKYVKGDPTAAYQAFTAKNKEAYDRLLNENPDLPTTTRATIQQKLDGVNAKFYDRINTARGKQADDFAITTTNASVGIEKQGMMDATANIDPDKPETMQGLESSIMRIQDLRIKQGLKNGTAVEIKDDAGNVVGYKKDPQLNIQIAKDLSDGIYGAINNLTASGDVKGAEAVTEKYKQWLDPVNRAKVEKETIKASQDQDAQDAFMSVKGQPTDKALATLNAIQDPVVQEKAMRLLDSNQRMVKNLEDRSSKSNYNAVLQYANKKQKEGQGFQDFTTASDDPWIKKLMGDGERTGVTDPKQVEAIKHLFDQPKDSNSDKFIEAYGLIQSGELKGMSPEDFNIHLAGLSKTDRSLMTRQWVKYNDPSQAKSIQATKFMSSQIADQMLNAGIVKHDQYGKYSDKDKKKLIEANSKFLQISDKLNLESMTPKDQNDFAQKFVADTIKQGVAVPIPQPKFNGSTKTRDVTPAAQADPQKALINTPGASAAIDTKSLIAAQDAFRKQFGRWPDLKTQELQDFMKKGSK